MRLFPSDLAGIPGSGSTRGLAFWLAVFVIGWVSSALNIVFTSSLAAVVLFALTSFLCGSLTTIYVIALADHLRERRKVP